ncbi:hypothetical protein LPW11_14090 [Geomonas sp. RF6]|uniref:hypothetical protein n=1 Tax=Geomonas sp. RF6 TaxID=2897342 RepID=UPI001E3E886B|nr:hypothetical protein [Geomonas sp. RF6]UFS69023.1 hypothetical protein LPW11_14090 [Geomonas sp. RF6]
MKFTLEQIRTSAMRLDSRYDFGQYVMRGPQENVMELESWLSFSSVAAKLHHEGYVMVPPKEYAEALGIRVAEVVDQIEKEGTLFALFHATHDDNFILVPLPEREESAPPAE